MKNIESIVSFTEKGTTYGYEENDEASSEDADGARSRSRRN